MTNGHWQLYFSISIYCKKSYIDNTKFQVLAEPGPAQPSLFPKNIVYAGVIQGQCDGQCGGSGVLQG